MALLVILTTSQTLAGVCDDAWKNSEKASKTETLCRLEWGNHGIEWVKIKDGCAMEGEKPSTCTIVRECDPNKKENGDIGEGVMRTPNNPKDYCLGSKKTGTEKTLPLFNRDRKNGNANLICSIANKPVGVLLKGPYSEKRCKFP